MMETSLEAVIDLAWEQAMGVLIRLAPEEDLDHAQRRLAEKVRDTPPQRLMRLDWRKT